MHQGVVVHTGDGVPVCYALVHVLALVGVPWWACPGGRALVPWCPYDDGTPWCPSWCPSWWARTRHALVPI